MIQSSKSLEFYLRLCEKLKSRFVIIFFLKCSREYYEYNAVFPYCKKIERMQETLFLSICLHISSTSVVIVLYHVLFPIRDRLINWVQFVPFIGARNIHLYINISLVFTWRDFEFYYSVVLQQLGNAISTIRAVVRIYIMLKFQEMWECAFVSAKAKEFSKFHYLI